MDACYKAKEKGADVVKQWDSTLDKKTRESHQQVDGEIRELDEKFSNGLMYPCDPSGGADEVVNCRCALLQRGRWALGSAELEVLQKRAAYFGLDKTKSFDEFKEKYLNSAYDDDKIYVGVTPITKTDNVSIRKWYIENCNNIKYQIDTNASIENQAKEAFLLRNEYKIKARVAMSDRETAKLLNSKRPIKSFEDTIAEKMSRKGLTREEAIRDILETATKTNDDVNKALGL